MQKKSTGFKLSVATLAIMNVTAVVSLRGLPAEAVYGPSSAFYYLFAAIVFLIPTSLVAAELAAMFADKQGGVFRWVGEAYGARTGFLAIWLQWIESTIWYPTVLTFGAVSIAFIGLNQHADMILASNKIFTLVVVLAIYWLATFISLKGLGWVGEISMGGGMIGTIIRRRTAHSAGHRLHRLGRSQPDGHVAGFLPRPDEVRQPGAGQQYLPLLRGYGDDGYSRDGREQSVEKLPESHHHRFARHGLHLRAGHLLAGLHHSGRGHQPDAIAADRFRQLLQVPAYVVGVAHHRHRADVRRAGRRADMGGRPFERYLRRGQGGLSASLLPEGQQERRTAQHPAHSGRRRNAAGAAVRGDAFGCSRSIRSSRNSPCCST